MDDERNDTPPPKQADAKPAPQPADPLLLPDDTPYVEGHNPDGTPYRLIARNPADASPAPLRPKSIAELREWIKGTQSIWLEYEGRDAASYAFWAPQRDVDNWLNAIRFLGLTPPPIPFPNVFDDPRHGLATIDALLRWLAELEAPAATDKAKAKAADKRSWLQPELDVAIEAEINRYSEAIASARKHSKGACQALRKVLGRNALANRLGVKAPKMVGNSPVWQQLADEFGMRRKIGKAAVSRPVKIGLAVAEEAAAKAAGDTTAADVELRETVALLDDAITNVHNPNKKQEGEIRQALTNIKDRLVRGEIDDDEARELIELYKSQQQDDHSRKVLNTL